MATIDTQTLTDPPFSLEDVLNKMQRIAWYSAATQMLLLLTITFSGLPGIYAPVKGLMYISNNFCTKPALGTLFIIATLPTWVLLTCSLALEPSKFKRRCLIFIMSLPMSTGLGIVFFSLCETHALHYVYVNTFVGSVGCIHLALTLTTRHTEFLQAYYILLGGTTVCSLSFVLLAGIATTPGVTRNAAVSMEYMAVIGFVLLNSLSADRIKEHVRE